MKALHVPLLSQIDGLINTGDPSCNKEDTRERYRFIHILFYYRFFIRISS